MSATVGVSLMIGVRLSDILRIEEYTEPKTKYNPDTGKPYEVQQQKTRLFIVDKEIEEPEATYPEEWVKDVLDMDVAGTGDSAEVWKGKGWNQYKWDHFIVGVSLGFQTGSSNKHIISANIQGEKKEDLAPINEAIKEATEKLARVGYAGPIGIHAVLYWSA